MLRLLTFACPGEVRLGALVGDDVVDLNRANPAVPRTLYDLIIAGDTALELARETAARVAEQCGVDRPVLAHAGKVYRRDEIHVLAPVPRPRRNVFCLGRNYLKHAQEGARRRGVAFTPDEYPVFFTKTPAAVIGTDGVFQLDPRVTEKLDYEVELAFIIGRHGRDIPLEAASDYVFGYTVGNDLSARDQQHRHVQWFKGKTLDNSCPLGPVVVPRRDLADPPALSIRLTVNGQERQHSNTSEMTFGVREIVYWLSKGTTLEPGDIILTGTPEGVGSAMTPPSFLQPGDVVEAEIESIGLLRTYIVGR